MIYGGNITELALNQKSFWPKNVVFIFKKNLKQCEKL